MAMFSRNKSFGARSETLRTAAPEPPRERETRLRDFCKAKAEVISSDDTMQSLRSFLNPFKDK